MDNQAQKEAHRALIEEWMQRYGDELLRLCFVWLRDAQLAEDAVSDTFFKAWQALPRYQRQHEGSDKAFLSTIAVNTCRDMRRSAWFRNTARSITLEDLPQHMMAVEAEDRSLFLTILALPERHRQIILLYHYMGLTLRECGDSLGIKPNTAHHRLKKAEAHLKTQLEGGLQHA